MEYTVKLDSFEGPLDLLYQMIKQNEIELNKVSLARVTEQYLEYTSYFQSFDLETASQFMVIAGELIQLKTRFLLPRPEIEEEEEDESDLVARLEEYEFFKKIAQKLKDFETRARDIYFRPREMTYVTEEEYELKVDKTPLDLAEIYGQVLSSREEEQKERSLRERINLPGIQKFKVEDRISRIRQDLAVTENNQLFFRQLLDKKDNFMEIVVTLLALLELVHLQEIIVQQDELFAEIKIIGSS